MKKGILVISTLLLLCLTGCGKEEKQEYEKDNTKLEEIKNGTLNACSNYTIKELIDNYMENPSWSKEKSDKGYYVYNVKGESYYNDELANILIQFAVDNDDIVIKSFEINKQEQSSTLYDSLVSDMCKAMKKDNNVEVKVEEEVITTISIENYVDQNYLEVKGKLEALGLQVIIKSETVSDSNINENKIIKQSVEPGTQLKIGTIITLTIPTKDVEYPDFTNGTYTVTDVMEFADLYSLELEIEEVETTEYGPGTIFYQSKPKGYRVISDGTQSLKIKVAKKS